MKIKSIFLLIIPVLVLSCTDLNLYPLSEGSSETWYSNTSEIEMAVYDLYRPIFWGEDDGEWSDDYTRRQALTPITNATINGEWSVVINWWGWAYKTISRSNTIIIKLEDASEFLPQETIDKFVGNAYFVRASQYAKLVFYWGDVVFFTDVPDLEKSFTMSRSPKAEVLRQIYADYDSAALKLPVSYPTSENKLATKGAALGMKARIALAMGDFEIARDAAKACMELGVYELYPDFGELFLAKTKNSNEMIFGYPRSKELGDELWPMANYFLPRNVGGYGGSIAPSWDLLCSFLCTDGKPIDESPLYDPHKPFENRDPRCTYTITEFGTEFLGYIYQPHPDSLEVLNTKTGLKVQNKDTRTVQQYASFNGLVWKKGIDETWLPTFEPENDRMILRYADVLLMYAEAKIELSELDQTVLDAINMVRARAYKVDPANTALYPAVTMGTQAQLRTAVRVERRMELAHEGLRYFDIIRWKIAEDVLNRGVYGMLDVFGAGRSSDVRKKVRANWFFPRIPDIDENGSPDFKQMYDSSEIRLLSQRQFDASKQYLWPIPTKEILINDNLTQNPGY